jgi:poly [ADP-ribose] polymerase
MSKFPEIIVNDITTGDFNTTVEYTVLSCGNIQGNNNKFYCIEIQKNKNNKYRLFCHRGRVGTSNVYTVRDKINNVEITDEELIRSEYNAIIKKKLKGKSKKTGEGDDYTEKYELVKVISPTVGSSNIRNATTATVKSDVDIKNKIENTKFSKYIKKLIQQFYDENIHNITHSTSIQISSTGGLQTALGPLTPDYIEDAKAILTNILTYVNLNNPNSSELKEYNNKYLSMVPRSIGRKITEKDMVLTTERVAEEFELLVEISAAVVINNTSANTDNVFDFGFQMVESSDKDKTYVSEWFEKSRASNHSNLKKWKVVNVFDLIVNKDRDRYLASTIKTNPVELWHGSKNCNLLSILMNGLIIPKANASPIE